MTNKKHIVQTVLTLFLVLGVTCIQLFASNQQKQYEIFSREWQQTAILCRLAGVVGPSSAGPVSGEELLIALNRIDTSSLSHQALYDLEKLRNEILEPETTFSIPDFALTLTPEVSGEIYAHTANENWIRSEDWYKDYKSRKAFAGIKAEMTLSNYLYGVVDYMAKVQLTQPGGMSDTHEFPLHFTHNWIVTQLQRSMPFTVGIAGGNQYIHAVLGRFRQSLGKGYTGNLTVGDNFSYQEILKFSFHNPVFTYNLSLTHFDQQNRTPIPKKDSDDPSKTHLQSLSFSGMHQVRVVQSYDITFGKTFTLGIYLGTMFQSDSMLDWRMLNPFMFMHNYNNFHNYNGKEPVLEANNFFTIGFEYVPAKSWQLTGQIMIDQIQLPSESKYLGDNIQPNAFGTLLNATNTTQIGNGYLNTYIEGVYTSPALYLNQKYVDETGKITDEQQSNSVDIDWNQDLIVGYALWQGDDLSYSGYIYGPDSVVLSLGMEYIVPNFWNLKCQLMYRMHGQRGISWPGSNQDQSLEGLTGADKLYAFGLTGTIEHTFMVALDGGITLYKGISIDSSIAFIQRWNNHHNVGETWNDLQFTFAVSIRPLDFFK